MKASDSCKIQVAKRGEVRLNSVYGEFYLNTDILDFSEIAMLINEA